MTGERPLIGISVGDPVGIGPEITARALSLPEIYDLCRPLVVGEAQMMRNAVRFSALGKQFGYHKSPVINIMKHVQGYGWEGYWQEARNLVIRENKRFCEELE
jgi:4-hydroxythreonine-4-phosphate dehydrogenase